MSHPVDSFVGKRLWLRRKILGLSQEAVAKEVGLTFQQVQKYERGVNRISASRLFDFGRVLSVPVAYFFEGFESANDDFKAANANSVVAAESKTIYDMGELTNPETLELLKNYSSLSPTLRRKINEMVKALASESAVLES